MVKPELGTKRICPVTGRKFYDLNKDPVISPYTGQIVPITAPVTRGRAEAPRPVEADTEVEENTEVELVSLEDADEEASANNAKSAAVDDDLEIDEDVASDDDDEDAFLEEDEDGDDDVSDLIGDGLEDDEES